MFRITIIIIICLTAFGCSSRKEISKAEKTGADFLSKDEREKEALEHFIDGTTAEMKGDFARAILEYQDAIRYDTSAGIYYGLAKNYYYLNKYSLALKNGKNAVKLDSLQTDYYDLLSDIFAAANQYDSSASVLEKLIKIDSTNINAYYKLARLYENDKPLEAIRIYNKLTSIIGPDWNVLLRVADLQEKLGRLDKSSEALNELLKLDPGNTSLQKIIIDFYQRNKMYDKALTFINDMLELTPDDLGLRERKGQIFIAQDKWEEASKEYSYILDQQNVPLDIKIKVAGSYFTQSLKDSTLLPISKKLFEKIDKDTADWQVKMYLGAIAISEDKDSLAIDYFKNVTELARWNVEGWIRLGGLYFDNRKYEESAKIMKEAVTYFPEDFTVNLILGLALSQDNKYAESKPYLKKAIDLNPSDINALSGYAFTLNQLKENDQAIFYLNKALKIKPNDVNLLGTLGLIYNSQKKYTLSDSVYEGALKIDSTNALVNNNYAYSLSERSLQLERALSMVKIALKADPENSSYLDTIGWIYFKMGDYQKAKKYVEQAIEKGGESAVMLEHLGDIVYKIGQQDYAKELWEKALQMDVSNIELKQKIEKGEI